MRAKPLQGKKLIILWYLNIILLLWKTLWAKYGNVLLVSGQKLSPYLFFFINELCITPFNPSLLKFHSEQTFEEENAALTTCPCTEIQIVSQQELITENLVSHPHQNQVTFIHGRRVYWHMNGNKLKWVL